ncbi:MULTISPECIES: amino acid adenylation domain-containing protein [unclassified Microcystis]|uniref:Non-ribosomal peptide synthetase n=1 Tax=Microcystis flos-aquae Mf_QC_C_20070823_S10D TaxID=2486236 RepID=A0A552L6K8_9CHRO|nr:MULTISPECIES: amino acid adenylation domain-containing protein [unclassified Microcystis]MCA2817116.1 amino acid adenylation domain-containing protein [Microcystis sp. M085S1]MCA2856838.1 amino acid adenylation domain-containing protein [Microcystis sp. M065S1]TRT77988.1 MAG: non-ribosomal peptide synthetase [Microcystis flos-aquae Ma_QC_C_20070823_S18]TRT96379.1 MAG: non-ribosomal peptide synthetase [Microcystis flos-aquae Ma_QC_C_20070823_S18D]TRV15860.1 MAG: non-ribosomal peptide synthet
MSNDQQIIKLMGRLRELGCRISADGDNLRLRKTKNDIPAELIQQIKINKTEILAFLNTAKDQAVTSQKDIPKLPTNALKQLSFAQQRLWFLGQIENSNATYNMPMSLQLEGKLNVDALFESLAYVIDRHESLRMYFPTVEGQPKIRIKNIENFNILSVQDLSNLDQPTQSIMVQTLINNHVQEPFNLKTGPLFKAKLLQLKDDQFILLLNMHHISSDGWSIGIFIRELCHAYLTFSQGQKPTLEPLPIQYSDFATWQRNWLQGEVLETQINYWKKQLKDAPPRLELPTDYPRPPIQSYKGSHYSHTLTPELTEQLKTLSQQEGVSLYMLLLAVFNLLLSRYSRQDDLCIGSPIANRPHPQTEGLIGFFANTLVLRNQIKSEQNFQQFLHQTRQTCLDAYQHQDIPFEFLVEQLKPVRSLSYNPIFQVMFAVENNDSEALNLPGLKIEWLDSSYPFAKFDLSLLALESDGQLNCNWEYATDLFETITIQRMAEHWEVLLQQIVTNPQQTISTLSWLTKADQKQLELWNQTNTNYPQDKTLVDLFEEQVNKTPDNIALVFEEQSLTYQELNQKANQLAHFLHQNYQIKPDTLIGICIERSLDMAIALLAVLKAGAAYVPIDSNYPEERIKYILENSKISLLLTQSFINDKLSGFFSEFSGQLINLDRLNFESFPCHNLALQSKPNDLAYVIYTSGSTGQPKGVMVEHKGLCNLALVEIETFDVHPSSRVLQFASFSFDAFIWEVLMAWGGGATLYLGNKDNLMPGLPLVERLRDDAITHITLPPSALAVLPWENLPSLQTIIVAGEACSPELVKKWSQGRNFFNGYGPTEGSVCATIAKYTSFEEKITIGRPIPNVQVYILDSHLQPVSIGVPGELHIGGAGLARGYLDRPDLTAEKFIEVNLLGKIERIYKTGDLAKWQNDGNIEFLGRIDHQIKLRGFRIELGEIEAVLLKHPAIKEVIVNLHKTENNQQLVAYVTGELIDDLSQQLKQHLKTHLPDYMIPSQIIRLDEFPLTPNGKIDRQALPHPNHESQSLYEAPRNNIEQQLTEIWSLIVECEKISIHDNFFDLGGHSILAIKLLNEIQKNFNQELSLTSLFQNPTIAQLAQQLSQFEVQPSISDLLVLQPSGQKISIFCVAGSNGHAFYFRDFAMNFADEHPVYGLETPGRDGSHSLPISVEDHASSLIKTLQQKQPKGPYILIGYSSGCSVALEMAFQLEQQGEIISLLGIFDAGLVANPDYITKRSDLDWIWNMIERIEAVKGISLGLNYEQLAAQSDDQNRWYLAAEALYHHNVLPEHSTLSLLRTNLEVMKRVTLNYAAYQPNFVISAPIVLFRAQDVKEIVVQEHQAMSHYQQSDWGWQPYSNKPVQVISVPGNHGQMLYEPNVKILADQLKKSIQEHFNQPET